LDGIARPNSSLNFKLYKKDVDGTKTFVKDFYTPSNSSKYFIDPIYITNPVAGVQSYLKEDVNYTSNYHNKAEFDLYDIVYGYDIKVTDSSSNTSTVPYETDEFIIYKVKLGDNLAKISSYYGVEIDDIKRDNNITTNTVKEKVITTQAMV
jgi:LysM domain.